MLLAFAFERLHSLLGITVNIVLYFESVCVLVLCDLGCIDALQSFIFLCGSFPLRLSQEHNGMHYILGLNWPVSKMSSEALSLLFQGHGSGPLLM